MRDADAFRRVVEHHQHMVYAIALRITCDAGLAEEVAQDAFVALYRSREQPAEAEHLRFWLRKAAAHGAISALRRQARQPEARAEEWLEAEHGALREDEREAGLEARLDDLMRALPEALRVPVALRYVEDLLPEEIAKVLEQPVATVKSNLRRGLSLLRRKAAVMLKDYVRQEHTARRLP